MYGKIKQHLINELEQIRSSGLFKDERILAGRQGATVELTDGSQVITWGWPARRNWSMPPRKV